jgi:H+-transporting ATPase
LCLCLLGFSAPALKQAEVGCAVSNATDVAKGSASALLLDEGLSGVPHMVEVGRRVHSRVVVWVVNKVAKAAMHSVFILVMFLILGRFPVSALQVVLLLLLMDFVLISLATDVQPTGHSPCRWDLAQLTRVGLSIGLPGAGQLCALILVTKDLFNQTVEENQTTAWLAMFHWGMLAVFSAREKSFFFKSRPSNMLVTHS